ncbi:MAG TPA: phage tail protein [Sphingopyxis sp.]|nr:phage tail protein [Sphingopyxis sp.]
MKKLNSLRECLTAALPELARNPDALAIYADDGTIATRDGPNYGFEMRYTATVTLLDCNYAPAQIFLPIVIWLREHQREVIQNHQTGTERIRFDVQPVDHAAVDVEIKLPLSEALDVLPDGQGGYDIGHRAEPPLVGYEALTDPATLLRQIWGQAEKLPPEFWTGYRDD